MKMSPVFISFSLEDLKILEEKLVAVLDKYFIIFISYSMRISSISSFCL